MQNLNKLDLVLYDLATSGTPGDVVFPVVVRAGNVKSLDAIESAIRAHGGRVRHVLRRLNSVSADVPLKGVRGLSGRADVVRVSAEETADIAGV